MNWKQDLDALIVSTIAFAQDVKRNPILDVPRTVRAAERALADASIPIQSSGRISPIVWSASERDEIRERAANFKAYHQKLAREREEYYLQMMAKMLAPFSKGPEN
jgi:hypothetical protein